jgi:hypothetical protein
MLQSEPVFRDQIAVRTHLASKIQQHPSVGYTYLMAGIWADILVAFNLLGLDAEKRHATVYGDPRAKISLTARSE